MIPKRIQLHFDVATDDSAQRPTKPIWHALKLLEAERLSTSSKVDRDLACTLASAGGAVAPLQIPRAVDVWALRCTIRRRLSLDELSPPDGPRQPSIDVPWFT
jgi:hypothetical protein